ncbi:MAG: hypothetical protein AAF652_14080 [Cyanobacteria bacterium P01_C01_bin.72]
MTNIPNVPANSPDYLDNLELSYDYLEKAIAEIQSVINNTNSQLGIVIGFNFTFIRFFLNELPTVIITSEIAFDDAYFWFKILAHVLAISSIILSFIGLYQSAELKIIKPDVLVANCDRVPKDELELAIIDSFADKLEDFRKLAAQKKDFFNLSIISLVGSGVMALLDEIAAAIF